MISIQHKKDLNKVTPNEITNKIIAHEFQEGIWAKKQENIAFATKNSQALKHTCKNKIWHDKKTQDQANKKTRKAMKSQKPQVNMKIPQKKICMHLEQVRPIMLAPNKNCLQDQDQRC